MTIAASSTGTVLDQILSTKREEVAALLSSNRRSEMLARCADLPPTRGFRKAIERAANSSEVGVALIAEVKKASPSKGVIREDFDPVEIALAYERGGATCLSVLTDTTYFQGSLEYLGKIRDAVALPLLRKDFLIDTAQVIEARIAGADAILLIVAAVPAPSRLAELRHVAESLGMDALVEVHDARETEIALESGATLIGVNNRDLRDFSISLDRAEELIPTFPDRVLSVAESGIFTYADVQRMRIAGASAVLVGESLMRQTDIAEAARRLLTDNG